MVRKGLIVGIVFMLALSLFTLSLVKVSASDLSLISKNHESCTEMWSCGTWSDCIHGERERVCRDLNHCGTIDNRPSEIKSCNCYEDICYRYNRYNGCNNNYCYTRHYYGYFQDKYLEEFYTQQNQLNQPNKQTQPQEVKIYQIMPSPSDSSTDITSQPQKQSYYSLGSLSSPWTLILILLGILSIILLIVIIIIVAVRK